MRETKFREVINVLSGMMRYAKKQPIKDENGEKLPPGAKIVKDKNGKVIRVMLPAKNDDWY